MDNLKLYGKSRDQIDSLVRTVQLWCTKLNGRNKILAIKIWAVSLLRYSGGIIRWNKDDLWEMDRQTRKLMTMNEALHPKSDINRICIPRRRGGPGLISAESSIQR